jgi:hypothetical protein
MKKMYILILVAVYLVTGLIAWFRGPLVLSARLKLMYPHYAFPVTWIKYYVPSDSTSDGAMKLGQSEQGKYKVNIFTGKWEKLTK